MRKFFVKLFSLTMVAVMAIVMFGACGSTDATTEKINSAAENTLDKMDKNNYTYSILTNVAGVNVNEVFKIDGNKRYMYLVQIERQDESTDEEFFSIEKVNGTDKWYRYAKENGSYYREELDSNTASAMKYTFNGAYSAIASLGMQKVSWTYSEEGGCYKCSYSANGMKADVQVKIESDMISEFNSATEYLDGSSIETKIKIYDIGTTTINLPSIEE